MKLKKSSVDAVAEEAKASGGGAFISARLRNPAEELGGQGDASGEKIGGVLAIVTVAVVGIVTWLLYMNWDAIKSA